MPMTDEQARTRAREIARDHLLTGPQVTELMRHVNEYIAERAGEQPEPTPLPQDPAVALALQDWTREFGRDFDPDTIH